MAFRTRWFRAPWVRLVAVFLFGLWVMGLMTSGLGQAEPLAGPVLSPQWHVKSRSQIEPPEGAHQEVVIVATSDLHGWVDRSTLYPDKRPSGLAYVAPVISSLRRKHPALILLDGGDALRGAPNLAWEVSIGSVDPPLILRLMNHLGYSAMTLGGHDLVRGLPRLERWSNETTFPFLAGNITAQGDAGAKSPEGRLLAPPYHIVEVAGVRIAILGLVTPGVHAWLDSEILQGWQVGELVAAAKRWVQVLQEEEKADVIIGLVHAGVSGGYDRDTAVENGLPLPNGAGALAEATYGTQRRGFDLIISGHAHKLSPRRPVSGRTLYTTPILEPGAKGEGLGVATFNLQAKSGRWRVSNVELKTEFADLQLDSEVMKLARPTLQKTREWLSAATGARYVGAGNWASPSTRKRPGQCAGALSHQAAKLAAKTLGWEGEVFSLLPALWRDFKWQPHPPNTPVTRADILRWIPYDNQFVLTSITARQAAMLLTPYIRWRERLSVRPTLVFHPGGLIPETKDKGTQVLALQNEAGEALSNHKNIQVVLTNYHWNGAGGLVRKALLQPIQKKAMTSLGLQEWIFRVLSDSTVPIPKECKRLMEKGKTQD